jgi:hypothetical protein
MAMTHAERNAAIGKKIEAYTARFASSRATASETLKREGFDVSTAAPAKKQQVIATKS